ncbi:TPA: hypothetical protein R8G72_004498 [Citrobacter youngae]|nr:hypothetical protein [Citrobacter youngae]HEF0074339.1 hypothetical protein [Citrobacter youngae]
MSFRSTERQTPNSNGNHQYLTSLLSSDFIPNDHGELTWSAVSGGELGVRTGNSKAAEVIMNKEPFDQ